MCDDPRDERIIEEDLYGTVEYAMRSNGKMEAKEWLESQDEKVQRTFGTMFENHMRTGRLAENRLKKISGVPNVYEYRHRADRLFCFKQDDRWLLTHHFAKTGSKKAQTKSAQRAVKVASEHFERESREETNGGEQWDD